MSSSISNSQPHPSNSNSEDETNTHKIDIKLTYKGKHQTLSSISPSITTNDLVSLTRSTFDLDDNCSMKLLHKGKVIATTTATATNDNTTKPALPSTSNNTKSKSPIKITVMATNATTIQQTQSLKSDPLIRGFDDEKNNNPHTKRLQASLSSIHPWGEEGGQHRNYKFIKMVECEEHSFGHRFDERNGGSPHSFDARRLLNKLANDPGLVAIMKERELVVNYLGEMDPIEDRIMQKHQEAHPNGVLLGYNTNRGFRIDLKLRSDDLKSFRPYDELMRTLIHELSHNWVGEHNVLFWSNYAQMRVEYLYTHWSLNRRGYVVNGKTGVDLAGVRDELGSSGSGSGKDKEWTMETIIKAVTVDVAREAGQHGIPVNLIVPSIMSRCKELVEKEKKEMVGQTVGSNGGTSNGEGKDARSLALEAAERRRQTGGDGNGSGGK